MPCIHNEMNPKENNYAANFNILGQLADKKTEHGYQDAHFPATLRRMRFVCAITAPAYLAAVYADSLLLTDKDFTLMATARILVAIIGLLALLFTFRKNVSLSALSWTTGIYMSALIATESLELFLKAGLAPLPETPITVFIVLVYYLYLPPQIGQSVFAAGMGSIMYLLTLTFLTDASAGHTANTTLIFALANGFGLYFCIRYGTSQRREYMALTELKHQAETDSLTNIYNRRRLMELGAREFHAAKRYGHPCSLLMLDIDHFKAINDTYGHAAGDKVLAGLASRCRDSLREVDLFGRIGGEEFAIVMPHCSSEQAVQAAERIRETVAKIPFTITNIDLNVTISIGISGITDDISTTDKLFQAADLALYQAKQDGRNRVRVSKQPL